MLKLQISWIILLHIRTAVCYSVNNSNQAGKKPGSLGAGLPANLALRGRILRSRGKILGSRGTILGSLGIFLNSRRHTKSKTITTELVALTYLGIDIS